MNDVLPPYKTQRIGVIVLTLVVACLSVGALVVIPARNAASSNDSATPVVTRKSGTARPPTTVRPSISTTSTSTSIASAGLTPVQAADFTIGYPTGWVVETLDVTPAGTTYRDTTIKRDVTDPHYVVRVDVLIGTNASTIAAENIARLSKVPSYRQITRRTSSFVTGGGTFSAVLLEFTMNHSDTGVPIQTIDEFFDDDHGHTFAVLTRSPVSEYSRLEPLFSRVRASIIPR